MPCRYLRQSSGQDHTVIRGPPLDIGGGGGGGGAGAFAWPFLFSSQRRWKAFFSHLRIGRISTKPCGHVFILPIFLIKIFISKKLRPPVF